MKTGTCVATGLLAGILGLSEAHAQAPRSSLRPRVADVTWPDAAPTAAAASATALTGLAKTKLPVLVPSGLLANRSLKLTNDETSYTAVVTRGPAKAPELTVSITGTRVAFDLSTGEQAKPSPDASPIVTELGDQSASASYTRFGAAYRVDIECRRPADARCVRADYARGLLQTVEFAGGGHDAPSAAPQSPEAPEAGMVAASTLPPGFSADPGELVAHSGTGVRTSVIYAANIRFPVESPPAYLNSQVYGIGGMYGPHGSASDPHNYAYPWHDNFCESRARATPACPGGKGHQGQDIRPAGPGAAKYWAVAVERGHIVKIGSFSVILNGASGSQYRYLHLEMGRLAVKVGDAVDRGQRIGLISNNFGATKTTVHLHFEVLQNVNGQGLRHVPPYSSLVAAYRQL